MGVIKRSVQTYQLFFTVSGWCRIVGIVLRKARKSEKVVCVVVVISGNGALVCFCLFVALPIANPSRQPPCQVAG